MVWTVLYEHKTRLETAVSQEKEIAKKAKDGTFDTCVKTKPEIQLSSVQYLNYSALPVIVIIVVL